MSYHLKLLLGPSFELFVAGVVMLAVWPGHMAFAGIDVDVSSGAIVDSCRSSICVAIAPAALCSGCRQQSVTPLLLSQSRMVLPLPLTLAILLAIVLSRRDDAMYWAAYRYSQRPG
jgi:hypothetical protein